MDKCREEFENNFGQTDGFHDGYVTWNEVCGMYQANDDDYECVADYMNGAFETYKKMQAKVEEMQKRVDKATRKWIAVTSIATTCPNQLPDEFFKKLDELHDALCGVGLEQALKGENHD